MNRANFFGLQFDIYCFYGNSTNLGLYGSQRPDSECNIPCTGQNSQVTNYMINCGGVLRNSVYSVVVIIINYLHFIIHRPQRLQQYQPLSIHDKLQSSTLVRSSFNSLVGCYCVIQSVCQHLRVLDTQHLVPIAIFIHP